MASPYSTGGGGTHFEARVVAYYLTAALSEAPARGVPGQYVLEVLTQRADFGAPLDDAIINGALADGRRAFLHLQVKSDLTFTAADGEWVSVLQQAWDTFTAGAFDDSRDRMGVAVNTYSARADKHYQSVLKWAAHSTGAQHFLERIQKKDFSHSDKRTFVGNVRTVLDAHAKAAISDDELWRFLRSFVIIHFDFDAGESSRDAETAQERLRHLLALDEKPRAADIWSNFIATVGEIMPVGGGATRATLVQHLQAASLPSGVGARFWKDVETVDRESRQALSTIKPDIHGLRLHRHELSERVRDALSQGRFVQIEGEPGSGKSAVLREFAEEAARLGPVFVLKDARIHPRGWSAHASAIGISTDLVGLMCELGTAGETILFIDGIDKISDPSAQLTINDIVIALAENPALGRWRILATVREQNLQHIETWLNPQALRKLPVRSVEAPALGATELAVVSQTFPRLRPLLLEAGGTDVILRRPFFLDAVLTLAGRTGTTALPASEVELLKLWWQLGGADRSDFTPAQHRRSALLSLAERLVASPDKPIGIRNLPPEPLDDLKSAGVIRDAQLGHSVVFSHDIYEEWALCEMLLGQDSSIVDLLQRHGEPQALVRPVQLLGSYALESNPTQQEWQAIYEDLTAPALRPVWQRTVLTSCLRSTRTTDILVKLADYLSQDNDDRLKRLLSALETLEVVPNATFLDEKLFPELSIEERVKLAQQTALPKPLTWLRFFDWYLLRAEEPDPRLIPSLLPVFSTWQSAFAGQSVRHCKRVGELAHAWLTEFEEARHPDRLQDLRDPFGVDFDYEQLEKLEKSIRALFLKSVGDVPELVSGYLRDKASHSLAHVFREGILASAGTIARVLPTELVDYILAVSLEHPNDDPDPWRGSISDVHELGIDGHSFYPGSPYQPPFLALLRFHEAEGLRLVRLLCNHSIAAWRRLQEHGRSYREPLTPLPVDVAFPWGTQSFWGDGQVYLWFRGVWGNDAVRSALMALEWWALEKIDAGDSFDVIFQKVLEGNESIAALGLATSLSLAYPKKSLRSALPLVTCPNIWVWDLARVAEEHGSQHVNLMGNWLRHEFFLTAVRDLNNRPHRSKCVRDLVPLYVAMPDEPMRDTYTDAVRTFTSRLPFEYAEQRDSPDASAELRKKMSWFVEQADPQYWHAAPAENGSGYYLWNDPPSAKSEEHVRQQEEHAYLMRCLALALWAQKSLDAGSRNDRFSIAAALAEAKSLDAEDLFDSAASLDEIQHLHRQAAVAGAAYVAARFTDLADWTQELAAWCFDVLQRAGATPPKQEAMSFRGSALSMHPLVFAVHGTAALLARDVEARACQSALLSYAVDPLEGVLHATAISAQLYAAQYREFYWVLFRVFLEQCLADEGYAPDWHSAYWDEAEAERRLAILDAAEHALEAPSVPVLPTIPLPWIERPELGPDLTTGGMRHARNERHFLWNLAAKTILAADIAPLLVDPARRQQFVQLISELIAFSLQSMVPPFAKSRRDRSGDTPFEWIFALSEWLGRAAPQLTAHEVRSAILDPLFAADAESGLLMMDSFARSYMIHGLLPPAIVTDDTLVTWTTIADWVFDHPEGKDRRGRHLDRHYIDCAAALLFCAHGDFRPLICGLDEGWPELPRVLPIVERAVHQFGKNPTLYVAVATFLRRGGMDLIPAPGLEWLANIATGQKQDQRFWEDNGDVTVGLLKAILERKSDALSQSQRDMISLISDILVDNGVRGAGFLQQEQLRG